MQNYVPTAVAQNVVPANVVPYAIQTSPTGTGLPEHIEETLHHTVKDYADKSSLPPRMYSVPLGKKSGLLMLTRGVRRLLDYGS